MSLVGDYGSDSEDDAQPISIDEDKQGSKRKGDVPNSNNNAESTVDSNNNNSTSENNNSATKKKPKITIPLPDIFDSEVSSSDNKYIKQDGTSSAPKQSLPEGKSSNLTPPQLWKKKGNISTEDTAAWNNERGRKKKQ